MKQLLLISCRGSEEVRSKCAPLLEKQLRSAPLQWRRSEAEFPVPIQLDVKFVAYSPSLIRKRESRWQDVAVAHLYFVDCWDGEKYRLDVRSDLIEWFATLRDADTSDWLVVFDACKARDSRGRGQVADKLRGDLFKYINRIVEIDSGLLKMPALVRALADQALISFDYWAQLFEAALKADRDSCFSLEWSFLSYMVTQVQYSRLLLSVNVFEQSLAQLDELDAMLSLLVSHYAASPTKARWLEALPIAKTESGELVSLVNLHWHFDDSIRQLITLVEDGDPLSTNVGCCGSDLRQIRAVIFCCQLSVILNRHNCQATSAETASERVIWYGAILIQAIRKEEAILTGTTENQSPFRRLSNALWCLEVFHFSGKLCDLATVSSESESMCTLWMTFCRMIQNLDSVRLSTAIGFPKYETPQESELPLSILEKCVVDTAAFDEQFVRWHESALAMLKHYGWRRHARAIGIALAEFYRCRGKDTEALHLFLKLARQLEEDRWCQAYVGLLLTIGDELLSRCTLLERLKLFGDLSCATDFVLSAYSPVAYCTKFKKEFESDWARERIPNSLVCPWFLVRLIKPDEKSVLCGSTLRWTVVLENRFPESVRVYSASLCCSLSLGHRDATSEHKPRPVKLKKLADFRRESYSVASDIADCSDLFTMELAEGNGDFQNEVVPGRSTMVFSGQCMEPGSCSPEHLHVRLGNDGRLDVVVRVSVELASSCAVKIEEPDVILISPPEGDSLWAGVTQTVKFRLVAGALSEQPMPEEDQYLRLETLKNDLQFSNAATSDKVMERSVCQIQLPSGLSPGRVIEVEQTLFCNIHGSNETRVCEVTSHWRGRSFRHQLRFRPIFHWMSDLKVIGERLLLTITLHNYSQRSLVIRDPKLTFASLAEKGGDIDAELLNDGGEQDLYFAIPYTLAWYVPAACTCLGIIVFHYQFKDSLSDAYTCYADVALQKPAIVEACCQMASEKIVCRVGMACDFVVSLKGLDPSLRSVDILVTLVFDTKFWSCTSSISELVRLKENGLGQAFFKVTPQCVGFLPMPSVVTQLTGDVALTKACQAYVRSKGKQVHVLAPLSTLRRSFNEKAPRAPLELQL